MASWNNPPEKFKEAVVGLDSLYKASEYHADYLEKDRALASRIYQTVIESEGPEMISRIAEAIFSLILYADKIKNGDHAKIEDAVTKIIRINATFLSALKKAAIADFASLKDANGSNPPKTGELQDNLWHSEEPNWYTTAMSQYEGLILEWRHGTTN